MPSDPIYLTNKAIDPARHHVQLGGPVDEWTMVLHESLESLGYILSSSNDGHFGEDLDQALKEFQYGVGVEADGVATDQTWDALANALAVLPAQPHPPAEQHPHQQYHYSDPMHPEVCREDPHAPPPASAHITGDLAHAEGWLHAYMLYRNGMGSGGTPEEQAFYRWADHSPEWQEAYAEYLQAMDDRQPRMWEDGSVSTRPEHEEGMRIRAIQRALAVLTGPSFGAIAYGVAKEAGASDETALGVGEMTGSVQGMAGAHLKATQQGTPNPASTAGPNYGEHPR